MPKRARGDRLTGGSGDVNPQLMSGSVTMTAANTATTATIDLPITRIPGSTARVTIVELLKVWVAFTDFPLISTAVAQSDRMSASFTTINWGGTAVGFEDPSVFARVQFEQQGSFSATGSSLGVLPIEPALVDLSDGAGHGILLAGDQVYVQVGGAGGATVGVKWKFLYRFKKVSLTEYIGIVQSQNQ